MSIVTVVETQRVAFGAGLDYHRVVRLFRMLSDRVAVNSSRQTAPSLSLVVCAAILSTETLQAMIPGDQKHCSRTYDTARRPHLDEVVPATNIAHERQFSRALNALKRRTVLLHHPYGCRAATLT